MKKMAIKKYQVTKNRSPIKEIEIDTSKPYISSVLNSLETILGRDLTDDELDTRTDDMYGNVKLIVGQDVYRFIIFAKAGYGIE